MLCLHVKYSHFYGRVVLLNIVNHLLCLMYKFNFIIDMNEIG